ncbi:MFS transporter [Oceanidesulfovibrio marinus]|nr:MFS transporter [Oceanidesulfovibrio marinus]
MQQSHENMGFIAATISLLMAFAVSATPIPLYDIYRRADGLTYSDLSLTAVVYFVGAITALLIFGRISDHLGRKPVTFLVFGLEAVACILLLDVDSALPLVIGRLLLGLACGLASSAIASYVVDSAPSSPHWLPAVVVANSPMTGLTLGAIASGALVEYGPYPRVLCYVVVLAGIVVSALLVALSKETVTRTPGLLASLRPKFSLPQADRRLYPVAACTFVATWALGGFFQAYGPSIAADQLGTQDTLTAALVFSSYLLPCVIGGPLAGRFSPATAQRLGMVVFTLAVGGVLVALKMSAVGVFLLTSAIAGAAQGTVVTGSIRSLLADVSPQKRAGVLSLIYATSYTGAAVPSFIAGQLSHFMGLFQIAVCYGFLAVLACIIILLFARNPQVSNVQAITCA